MKSIFFQPVESRALTRAVLISTINSSRLRTKHSKKNKNRVKLIHLKIIVDCVRCPIEFKMFNKFFVVIIVAFAFCVDNLNAGEYIQIIFLFFSFHSEQNFEYISFNFSFNFAIWWNYKFQTNVRQLSNEINVRWVIRCTVHYTVYGLPLLFLRL